MDIFPIWKTTYYTTSEESVTFRILKWGTEEIYRARASRYPDENILRINLNKPCQNTLDSKMIPSTGFTDSVERSNAYAEYELQSLDGDKNWVTIYSFAFFNDWSYDPHAPAENLSEPINGHAAPDQLVSSSYIVSGDTATKCYN